MIFPFSKYHAFSLRKITKDGKDRAELSLFSSRIYHIPILFINCAVTSGDERIVMDMFIYANGSCFTLVTLSTDFLTNTAHNAVLTAPTRLFFFQFV